MRDRQRDTQRRRETERERKRESFRHFVTTERVEEKRNWGIQRNGHAKHTGVAEKTLKPIRNRRVLDIVSISMK